MPSFRDLKGRPVEEVVDSRALPGLPDPGEQMVEREVIKQAVEKMTASRGRFTPPDDDLSREPGVVANAWAGPQSAQELPEDMAQALAELEATLAVVNEYAGALQTAVLRAGAQIQAVRARAEKDAAKLAKVGHMLKALEE